VKFNNLLYITERGIKMGQERTSNSVILWLSVIFFLVTFVTGTIFFILTNEPSRGQLFYMAMTMVITAELVLFAHIAHTQLENRNHYKATYVTRLQINRLIFLWLVATVVTAFLVLSTGIIGPASSGFIFISYSVLTLLFFIFTYMVYSHDLDVSSVNREIVRKQERLQVNIEPLEEIMHIVKQLGNLFANQAFLADKIQKKLEIIRNTLSSPMISERNLANQDEYNWVQTVKEEIEQLHQYGNLNNQITSEESKEKLEQIAVQSEKILALLQQQSKIAYSLRGE